MALAANMQWAPDPSSRSTPPRADTQPVLPLAAAAQSQALPLPGWSSSVSRLAGKQIWTEVPQFSLCEPGRGRQMHERPSPHPGGSQRLAQRGSGRRRRRRSGYRCARVVLGTLVGHPEFVSAWAAQRMRTDGSSYTSCRSSQICSACGSSWRYMPRCRLAMRYGLCPRMPWPPMRRRTTLPSRRLCNSALVDLHGEQAARQLQLDDGHWPDPARSRRRPTALPRPRTRLAMARKGGETTKSYVEARSLRGLGMTSATRTMFGWLAPPVPSRCLGRRWGTRRPTHAGHVLPKLRPALRDLQAVPRRVRIHPHIAR